MNSKLPLAPISITVYDRLDHLEQCLRSLTLNELAIDTELYIFSDAAKAGDEEKVNLVRDFCKKIDGFREVHLTFQSDNDYKKNMSDARVIPLRDHGRMIRMEDDNIVSPSFLTYMNEALEYYEDNPLVLAVSGYSPPIYQEKYTKYDVYLSKIFSAWTYATWSHKNVLGFCQVSAPHRDMTVNKLQDKVQSIHPSLCKSLKMIDAGIHYAPDQILTYFLIKHDYYQIKPVKSLVRNNGHDGSGINCGVSTHFDQPINAQITDPRLLEMEYVADIDMNQYKFFYPSFLVKVQRRVISLIRKLIMFKSNLF